ncbi:vWA-MoxR associated conflict system protein [Streptomyces gardneri]|uniref:vWA-MoxR associated conflict system protein n=1 Tax=Streptomyces gardneri TaxID=66892 RepID=UPI0035E1BC0E
MTEARHVLVIAAQCLDPALGALAELQGAAASLHEALTSPALGACESRYASATLLYGEQLTQILIEQAIRAAGRRAGEAGAVLVLALLGHGIESGGSLHYMGSDARQSDLTTTVDVASHLRAVAETPGLGGLMAIVDTCHAGGATPDLTAIASGIRRGHTRFSVLMGAGVGDRAFDLRFSRTVTKVLCGGIARAGERLSPAAVVDAVRLDGGASGQDVYRAEFDGAQFEETGLWLAYNLQAVSHGGAGRLGPVARTELAAAFPELTTHELDTCDDQRLSALLEELICLPPDRAARGRMVLAGIRDCLQTLGLLRAWPGSTLTSKVLHRSLVDSAGRTSGLPAGSGDELLRDAVEFLRLRAPAVGQRPTAPLVGFMAALAVSTDVDATNPALRGWAAGIGAGIDLSDAFEHQNDRTRTRRLRLIVGLHAAVGDEWPASLTAWLLDGNAHREHREFMCEPDQTGVEEGIGEALGWATELADALDVPLYRVEIAAPAPLLVRWRPEETSYGEMLGEDHDVVLRWSERMAPPRHLSWINGKARKSLLAMESCQEPDRVHWLDESDTRHHAALDARLRTRPAGKAVALGHRPSRLADVVARLLAASPIVLWPDEDAEGSVSAATRRCVDESWHLLPTGFCDAYRKNWYPDSGEQPPGPAGGPGLHRLRAVWDGPEWLEFCSWFKKSTTQGENS